MHFIQEYKTAEQAAQFNFSLSASLDQLKELGCDCKLNSNPIGKRSIYYE